MHALKHPPIVFLLISASSGARVARVTVSQDGTGDFKSSDASEGGTTTYLYPNVARTFMSAASRLGSMLFTATHHPQCVEFLMVQNKHRDESRCGSLKAAPRYDG